MTDYTRGADSALGYRWRADKTAIERLGLTPGRSLADRQVQASIIASLALHYDRPREAGESLGRVSYSRSTDHYDVPERYRSTPYSRKRVCAAIDGLAEAGLIVNMKALPGAHLQRDEAKRLQSACYALPAMMDRLKGLKLVDLVPRCPLILRDINGDLVDYAETERTRRFRKDVEETNAWLESVLVTIDPAADPANWRRTEHHLSARKVKADGSETWATVVPGQAPSVVRIFSRSRFDLHGRYYGFWQGLPKDRRGDLLIDGEFTVEPDFHWLHPTLLYAMCGHAIAHDPYTTGYWPRAAGKLAFNTAINAKTDAEAIGGLLKKRDETGDDGEPVWRYGRRQTGCILEAIKEANPHIAHMFGSDAGVRLMAIDSGMAGRVMKGCRKAGIPCLPVHDSFRVPARHEGTVTAIMGEVLASTLVGIKSKVSGTSIKTYRHNDTSLLAEPREPSLAEPAPLPAERVETPLAEPGYPVAEPVGEPLPEAVGPFLAEPGLPAAELEETPVAEPLGLPVAEPVPTPAEPIGDPVPEPGGPVPGTLSRTLYPPTLARPVVVVFSDPVVPRSFLPDPRSRPPLDVPGGAVSPFVATIASDIVMPSPSPSPAPRPRSAFDAPKERVWKIREVDGRIVTGPTMFMEPRARALQALGHDPFDFTTEGRVSPGL
ncbi:hypothetical protein MKK58_17750 [Methylobacterium sp. J-078]|uniref:hypothetical protein n=1 Tax=Methylobacterium sp. J-078 TaxID=2836657 RepID=UPI001FBB33D9|nr:hypothetical protein [Methylobacterium sp. J-078]MCJ2046363.1 hypothetical protein [Methylobacterium sp. J-078]